MLTLRGVGVSTPHGRSCPIAYPLMQPAWPSAYFYAARRCAAQFPLPSAKPLFPRTTSLPFDPQRRRVWARSPDLLHGSSPELHVKWRCQRCNQVQRRLEDA